MIVIDYPSVEIDPRVSPQVFIAKCVCGHESELSVDDYEGVDFNCSCVECDKCGEIVDAILPDEIECFCRTCTGRFSVAASAFGLETHSCLGGLETDRYLPVGGYGHLLAVFEDAWSTPEEETFITRRRQDYWNVLTHYTSADHFISILRSNVIEARPTGYFGSRLSGKKAKEHSKAVCLSETPWEFDEELRKRFGEFGFMFEKAALRSVGCSPVVNIQEDTLRRHRDAIKNDCRGGATSILGGFHKDLLPFINKIGSDFSYVHEREWRVPKDINLNVFRPLILLPDDYVKHLIANGSSLREISQWLLNYPRARVVNSDR